LSDDRKPGLRINGPGDGVPQEFDAPIENADRRKIGSGRVTQQPAGFVACRAVPSLLLSLQIGHVRRVRAEEQVIGVDTAPFVAAMTDMHAGWNRAVSQFPRPPMRELSQASEVQSAISGAVHACLPDETAGQPIALGEMGEALFGGPMRGAPQDARIRRAMVVFHAPNLRAPGAISYFGHWLCGLLGNNGLQPRSNDRKAVLARRLSTGFWRGPAWASAGREAARHERLQRLLPLDTVRHLPAHALNASVTKVEAIGTTAADGPCMDLAPIVDSSRDLGL
jgi:hypothetical protein